MKLYNPPNIKLPALKIEKTRQRKAIEDDPTVKNLLRSNLLLDFEFNTLYFDILKKSKELLNIISLNEDQLALLAPEYTFHFPPSILRDHPIFKIAKFEIGINIIKFIMYYEKYKKGEDIFDIPEDKKKQLEDIFDIPEDKKRQLDEAILKLRKEIYPNFLKQIIEVSNNIQDSISDFEEKREIELSILSSTNVYVCQNCSKIISINKFKPCTCACGEKITKISQQVNQISIYHFNKLLIDFVEQNYWLEYGVDYLLRRKNFQTLVGYNVLGHSGVWHEIDNIADIKSENYRILCECKNTKVEVYDIFVFSGKMVDVGCTHGYVFTTSEKISDDAARLARQKNIEIVKGVLTRETEDLLEDIKEG